MIEDHEDHEDREDHEDHDPGDASFTKLVLTDEQRRLVNFFGDFGAERLGVSPISFRGFLWKAARDWQQRNRARVAALDELTPDERFRHTEQMMELFLDRAGRAFPSVTPEDLEQLRKDGLELYRKTFNRRE